MRKGCGKKFGLAGAGDSFYFICCEEEKLCNKCLKKYAIDKQKGTDGGKHEI